MVVLMTPEPIPDIEVPCLEDPTKTCKLVNEGTHITSLDGSPARSIKEVAENLPPHDEQTLAALEEAVKAQEEVLAEAKKLDPGFDPVAGLRNPAASSPLVGENICTFKSVSHTGFRDRNTSGLQSADSSETSVVNFYFGGRTIPGCIHNQNSVHTVQM